MEDIKGINPAKNIKAIEALALSLAKTIRKGAKISIGIDIAITINERINLNAGTEHRYNNMLIGRMLNPFVILAVK